MRIPDTVLKLLLAFLKWLDSVFTGGALQFLNEVREILVDAVNGRASPLNWQFNYKEFYTGEESVIWVLSRDNQKVFLPQTLVISPLDDIDESEVNIELLGEDFSAPFRVNGALDYYSQHAGRGKKKMFFDGKNARIVSWDSRSKTMVFQGNSYFDYLQTNLALDATTPALGSLREQISVDGKLEPLSTSGLANSTGINGLIFSNDGYLIFQKREENVLVRPGELCSGFSGTIDKIDLQNIVPYQGAMARLDAPREMVEELGINRSEVSERHFLGLTRELIRGGAPELFFSLDVNLPAEVILSRVPRDIEGRVRKVFWGVFARTILEPSLSSQLNDKFWSLLDAVKLEGDGPISVPLLTNFVLWYQKACPDRVGIGSLSKVLDGKQTTT